jgi:hypothetical protein
MGRMKVIRELTETQKEYISKKVRDSIKYSNGNDCYIRHEYNDTWSVYVTNIESNRFYLHNLSPKYFVLDTLDVNKNNITFQFSLTKKFFKEIL